MTTDIAIRQATLPEQVEFSKTLSASKLLPPDYRGNPANVLFGVQYAIALNIDPIHALTSIHVISGKPTASADLIAAVVRRAGHKLRIQSTDTKAVATLIRADDPDFPYVAEWDMEKAKTAQLLSNPSWKKYPAAMLRSRAITEVARQGASDALFGVVYTPEELGADVDVHGAPVRTAQQQPTGRVTAADILDVQVVDAEPETDPPLPVEELITPAQMKKLHALFNEKGFLPVEELITPAQMKKLHALFNEKGFQDRDDRLAYVNEIVGIEVGSSKDLTKYQASRVIDALDQLADVEPVES